MTSIFDMLREMRATDEQKFLDMTKGILRYILSDERKNPDKYRKIGIVCIMPEWVTPDKSNTRFVLYIKDALALLEGTKKMTTIRTTASRNGTPMSRVSVSAT